MTNVAHLRRRVEQPARGAVVDQRGVARKLPAIGGITLQHRKPFVEHTTYEIADEIMQVTDEIRAVNGRLFHNRAVVSELSRIVKSYRRAYLSQMSTEDRKRYSNSELRDIYVDLKIEEADPGLIDDLDIAERLVAADASLLKGLETQLSGTQTAGRIAGHLDNPNRNL